MIEKPNSSLDEQHLRLERKNSIVNWKKPLQSKSQCGRPSASTGWSERRQMEKDVYNHASKERHALVPCLLRRRAVGEGVVFADDVMCLNSAYLQENTVYTDVTKKQRPNPAGGQLIDSSQWGLDYKGSFGFMMSCQENQCVVLGLTSEAADLQVKTTPLTQCQLGLAPALLTTLKGKVRYSETRAGLDGQISGKQRKSARGETVRSGASYMNNNNRAHRNGMKVMKFPHRGLHQETDAVILRTHCITDCCHLLLAPSQTQQLGFVLRQE
ncbi:unnamed protein product, partial [Pleuronectes platessa]